MNEHAGVDSVAIGKAANGEGFVISHVGGAGPVLLFRNLFTINPNESISPIIEFELDLVFNK